MKKLLFGMAFLLLLCGAVFFGGRAVIILRQNRLVQESFDALTAQAEQSAQSAGQPDIARDYSPLFAQYEDLAAWVQITGTRLDYPVMCTPRAPDYYLRRDINGSKSNSGVPYLQADCDLQNGEFLIIYGHNMEDGSMFAALKDYLDPAFGAENPIVLLTTPTETRHYAVYAVCREDIGAADAFAFWRFPGEGGSREEYLAGAEECAVYTQGERPTDSRQLLTLSTCDDAGGTKRLLLVAALQ